jgi:membrane-bound inhibitor of C-type lysozyme
MNRGYLATAMAAAFMLAGCNTTGPLPGNEKAQKTQVTYQCSDGEQLAATYYNGDPNRLAIVKKGNQPALVMVNVVAGSGAKYVGNIYEWWTKGDSGNFTQLMDNTITECRSHG